MGEWFSRPVFFVESVERTIAFYTDKLGFTEGPRYGEDSTILVGEVKRGDCTLLLNSQQPTKTGRGMFISLDVDDFNALRTEFCKRSAPIKEGLWGSNMMIVEDPDGNELFFPYP